MASSLDMPASAARPAGGRACGTQVSDVMGGCVRRGARRAPRRRTCGERRDICARATKDAVPRREPEERNGGRATQLRPARTFQSIPCFPLALAGEVQHAGLGDIAVAGVCLPAAHTRAIRVDYVAPTQAHKCTRACARAGPTCLNQPYSFSC